MPNGRQQRTALTRAPTHIMVSRRQSATIGPMNTGARVAHPKNRTKTWGADGIHQANEVEGIKRTGEVCSGRNTEQQQPKKKRPFSFLHTIFKLMGQTPKGNSGQYLGK